MSSVNEYKLEFVASQDILLPKKTIILDIQKKGDDLIMIAGSYKSTEYVYRRILIVDIGEELPTYAGEHIKTILHESVFYNFFEDLRFKYPERFKNEPRSVISRMRKFLGLQR